MGEQRMSIPKFAFADRQDACRVDDQPLEAFCGVLEAPAVAKKRASALKGDLSRT
jgi:hypothetical protein